MSYVCQLERRIRLYLTPCPDAQRRDFDICTCFLVFCVLLTEDCSNRNVTLTVLQGGPSLGSNNTCIFTIFIIVLLQRPVLSLFLLLLNDCITRFTLKSVHIPVRKSHYLVTLYLNKTPFGAYVSLC